MNPYVIVGGLVVIGSVLFATHHDGVVSGRKEVQGQWDADKVVKATAESVAVMKRSDENLVLEFEQAAKNAAVTKVKNEEIATLRQRIADAPRMRKPSFCAGAGLAPEADAKSPSISDGTDTGTGLLSKRVDEDIRALILKTEEVSATGRACQSWITKQGFAP